MFRLVFQGYQTRVTKNSRKKNRTVQYIFSSLMHIFFLVSNNPFVADCFRVLFFSLIKCQSIQLWFEAFVLFRINGPDNLKPEIFIVFISEDLIYHLFYLLFSFSISSVHKSCRVFSISGQNACHTLQLSSIYHCKLWFLWTLLGLLAFWNWPVINIKGGC